MNYVHILLVGLGGCLGAIARDKLGAFVLHNWSAGKFPLSTLTVNMLGCVAAGIVSGLIERQGWFSPQARIFLMTGVFGGFTTFSAFGVETLYLVRRGELLIALLYVGLSVICGLMGMWLGMSAVPHRLIK